MSLGYEMITQQRQQPAGEAQRKLLGVQLANVFGFGAELARLCIVKLVQFYSRKNDHDVIKIDGQVHFETYLQVVNRAIALLCKVNQLTEAALVCERADELRKQLPYKFH